MKNLISALIFFIIVYSFFGFYLAVRPLVIHSSNTPSLYGLAYEDVTFKTQDNLTIKGWFIPNINPHAKTIILLHGYPADKGNILPSTIFLHRSYHLLYFDFRYLGQSGGHYTTVGKNEVLDLLAAIHYLHQRHIKEVGVWGFSLGAAVALMTAPLSPDIKAIVADSSYARLDWMAYEYYRIPLIKYPLGMLTRLWALIFLQYDITDVSPVDAAKKITVPLLLIHSKNDKVISYDHALLLQKAVEKNSRAEIIITDTEHGQHFKNYQTAISNFYEKNLSY